MKKTLLFLLLLHAVIFTYAAPSISISTSECDKIDARLSEVSGYQRNFCYILEILTAPDIWSERKKNQTTEPITNFSNLLPGLYRVRCVAASEGTSEDSNFFTEPKDLAISNIIEIKDCGKHIPIGSKVQKINSSLLDVHIFPNPANTEVQIQLNRNVVNQAYTINLYSLTGQLIITTDIENNWKSIDVSDLSNGIYFISVLDDKNVLFKDRLVINRK
jgi:hypothetical protein